VRLTALVVFAAGYVVGARAGRERYVQILDGMARASEKLEEYSARWSPEGDDPVGRRADDRS
jgi:hypothetical protein